MGNILAFETHALYKLKQEYGVPVDLYVVQKGQSNVTTGQRATVSTRIHIEQAIVVGMKFFEQGLYNQAFLKADRQYSYGAFQSQDWKTVVVDSEDLPEGMEIDPQNRFVIEHKGYEVFDVKELPGGKGYLLIVKRLTGTEPNEIAEEIVRQKLRVAQSLTVTKNSPGSRVYIESVIQTLTFTQDGGGTL